ncbi:MAG: DUF3568 family protein [Desulfobacterales bacterium]
MRKNFEKLILLASFIFVTGCAVALIGIGAAAVGTVAYKNGKLIKTYPAKYNATVAVSNDTLKGFKFSITEEIADNLKTVIKARRPDGTPVEIEVVKMDSELTEVGVRTGVVGFWDKRVSEQIQNSIGKRLSPGSREASRSTADSDRQSVKSLNKDTSPQVAAAKDSDRTSVSNIPTESSTGRGVQAVAQKSSKKEPDFLIYFADNSNELSEDAIEKLNTVAAVIINDSADGANIYGYSDSAGSASFNKMLSESRANTVKIYLIGKGVHPGQITAKGFGSDNPMASNNLEEGRRLNRRVEIELIYR